MSKKVLSIQVNLKEIKEKGNIIEVEIEDQHTKSKEEFELNDDSNESFKIFTDKLKNCLITLQKVLPHKKRGLFVKKENDILLKKTVDYQNEVLSGLKQEEEIENECNFKFNKVNIEMKDKLTKLIQQISQEEVDKKVSEAVDKGDENDVNRIYCKEVLKCSNYLGTGKINNIDKDIFISKDGIITDGYVILPFILSIFINEKIEFNSINMLWKLANSKSIFAEYINKYKLEKQTNQEYEIASQLIEKYGTYETDDIDKTEFIKGVDNPIENCDTGFDVESLNDSKMKENLKELIDRNEKRKDKLSKISLTENITKQFIAGTKKPPIETHLNYLLKILECNGTKYLGDHKINSIENIDVYLTTDGIITDGYKILPFDIDDNLNVQDGYVLTGGYNTNWTLVDKSGTDTLKSNYFSAVKKMKTEKKYYGGSKNRRTRRK